MLNTVEMTFTNRVHSLPRSILFKKNPYDIQLMVHGQCTFLFKNDSAEPCKFVLFGKNRSDSIFVQFTKDGVTVDRSAKHETYTDPNCKSALVNKSGAYYWFSLDSQNQVFMAGLGEPSVHTCFYQYQFKPKSHAEYEANKLYLEGLNNIALIDTLITPYRLLRDPVTDYLPLYVADTDTLTMDDIAKGYVMPKSNLSIIAQKLYHCISGKNFVLDDDSFPDFSKAIEYSIATPGLWCHERLKKKANEFNKDKPEPLETYLRITLGQNNGESPGVPYVMEIWPVGHYSPIHNHGGAHAVIRVLHGGIHVKLFPFLCAEGIEPHAMADFEEGDITWISPTLNQVHQLENLKENTKTCITIQCYMYDEGNKKHYDYFDYIDSNKTIEQYEPDSDMDFIAFKELMKQEWNSRPQSLWSRIQSWFCNSRRRVSAF